MFLNIKNIIILTIVIFHHSYSFCQYTSKISEKPRFARILFYNTENLFDTQNDSLKNDDEFTPNGERKWTSYRYHSKLNNIATVIASAGGWDIPEIVGLCEIENRRVLEDLCKYTGLSKFNYKIIHKESPDKRGIDVALLYRKQSFKPINYSPIPIKLSSEASITTRDILYVKGILKNTDTLHLFINHWPSRWDGTLETEYKRIKAALTLQSKIDSIQISNKDALIVVMGDLNDTYKNKSISKYLNTAMDTLNIDDNKLYNLFANVYTTIGTHKNNGIWSVFDHIFVSGSLLKNKGLGCTFKDARIYSAPYLLIKDNNYSGSKCFRTYSGYKYKGGYSDHLPIFLDLHKFE